jgi:RNA polymerase sigma factor FliA
MLPAKVQRLRDRSCKGLHVRCALMTEAERDHLVVEHLPHVRIVARKIYKTLPTHYIEVDDLCSHGAIGLIHAAKHYDGRFKFWTYAERRVRGEMLDALRAMDYLSRDTRRAVKAAESAVERWPEWCLPPLSLSATIRSADGVNISLIHAIADNRMRPDVEAKRREIGRIIYKALSGSSRHGMVVMGIFWGGESNIQIAKKFGTHESRVSQLKGEALYRITQYFSAIRATADSF